MILYKECDKETKKLISDFIDQEINNSDVHIGKNISESIATNFGVIKSAKSVSEYVKRVHGKFISRGKGAGISKIIKEEITETSITRRCKNKLCINRFVPVNANNFFCSSVCHNSDLEWTTEEILQEEGSLLPEATNLEMAKRAFEQKNQLIRKNTYLTSLRDFMRFELKDLHDSTPELRFPIVPIPNKNNSSKSEREIIVVASDWQIGKMENGIGIKIMEEERIPRLMDAARKITEHFKASGCPINTGRLVLLGDLVEGCLPAGSIVSTPTGPIEIQNIQKGDYVWAYTGSGFKAREVIASEMTGIDPIYTIGSIEKTIKANAEHPILVQRRTKISTHVLPKRNRYITTHEYIRASDVREGDLLCIVDDVKSESNYTPVGTASIELMEILGFYLGNGCLTRDIKGNPSGIYLSHDNKNIGYMDRYWDICKQLFIKHNGEQIHIGLNESGSRFSSKQAAEIMVNAGVAGYARTKRVPKWVFNLSNEYKLAFLRGYLDSDGYVNKLGQIVYSSTNKDLIRDINELCVTSGLLTSRIRSQTRICPLPQGGSMESVLWVSMCNSSDLNMKVGSYTPIYNKRWGNKKRTRRVTTYPVCDKGRVVDPPLGCRYSKVLEINKSEIAEPVYNITVDQDHTFIADGVVTHNCFIYAGQNVSGLDKTANSHRITRQIPMAARLVASLAMDMASYFPEVIVDSVPGNHGRPNGKNDYADPEDNFDTMLAWWAQDKCINQSNIKWNIHENWWGKLNSLSHDVVMMHGDQWRGPVWDLQRLLPQWALSNIFKCTPELVLTGHRHDFASFRVGGITVCQNGTIDGGSNWYLKAYGKISKPSQTVLVMSEKRGLEALYPVYFSN